MDETQIRLAIDIIKNNGLVEVRIPFNKRIYSGYFKDIDNLIKQVSEFQDSSVYFVFNDIDEACYSRAQNEKIIQSDSTTSDKDITSRRWMLIDIDPVRPVGVSSTNEEKEEARIVGLNVFKFLRDNGFSAPVSADSGNGYHLLYPIFLKNSQENTDLIKNILAVLDMLFSTESVKIDTSVYNPSRITKLYGTVARKGKNTEERPHRLSKITKVPDEIKPTDISLLRKIESMLPIPEERNRWNSYGSQEFDLDQFIARNNIKVKAISNFSGGTKYILEHCVFNEGHTQKDAAIFKLNNGAIGYKCFHSSCSHYKWQDVRKLFEPRAYEYSPHKNKEYGVKPVIKTAQVENKGEKFLELSKIQDVDRSNLVYIKSHFEELDKNIIGFMKGELSIWTGNSSSGKSTLLGQLSLAAINDGFTVLMYSGELKPHRVKKWLHLQAAGRQFVRQTDFEKFYYVPERYGKLIDEWIGDKFFLYNNDYGSEYTQLIADLRDRLNKNDIDVIVLDNIMTLDIDELGNEMNSQQTSAVKSLSALAKEFDIHIHVVAHPKKAKSLLRPDDISGTGNIRNIADNVFIVHRVNNDFIRQSNEYFGEAVASRYHSFNNVIEVAKNRDLGVQDLLVGLYFEVESKRMLNDRYENIVYGWQDIDKDLSISPQDYNNKPFTDSLAFVDDNDDFDLDNELPFTETKEQLF